MKLMLVGVDNSARAGHVLRTAVDLATKIGAQIIVVRAVTLPVDVPLEAYAVTPASLTDMLVRDAKAQLDKMVRDIPTGMLLSSRVELGVPWQVLCDVAKETHASMLVIGSHGYTTLDRVLGTTAAKVVNHATCSILVVRSGPQNA